MEDVGSTAVALEFVGGTEVLAGGVGQQLKGAVAALGGGGGRRTCNNASASTLSKPRAYYYNIGISIGEDGKRRSIQCKGRTLAAMARR